MLNATLINTVDLTPRDPKAPVLCPDRERHMRIRFHHHLAKGNELEMLEALQKLDELGDSAQASVAELTSEYETWCATHHPTTPIYQECCGCRSGWCHGRCKDGTPWQCVPDAGLMKLENECFFEQPCIDRSGCTGCPAASATLTLSDLMVAAWATPSDERAFELQQEGYGCSDCPGGICEHC